MDRLLEFEDRLNARFENLEKRLDPLEQALLPKSNDTYAVPKSRASAPVVASIARSGPSAESIKSEPVIAIQEPVIDEKTSFQGHSIPDPLAADFEDPMKSDNEGELSIPVEHTTAAHKLLMWPSIKKLLYPNEYDEDYVMRLEEERGLISVFGQGEISSTADDTHLPTPPAISDNGVWDECRIDGSGTYQTQGSTSLDFDAEIDRYGLLRLDAKTARRYYQSYLDRIHKLHPFMDQYALSQNVEVFIRCYCPHPSSPTDSSNTLCRDGQRGAKRKRSLDDLQGVRGAHVDPASASSRPRVGRNIDNAIILLVFALGSICETKSPLPGPIMDKKIGYRDQHIPGPLPPMRPQPVNGTHAPNGVLSPANSDSALPASTTFYSTPLQSTSQSFPSSIPTSQTLPASTTDFRKRTPRRAIPNSKDEFGNVENLQVIPGLALYGYATAILGHLQGGVDLEHVQAGLLAGLYAGQLAHPFQSHGWICQAARACQVLVRQ